MNTRVNYLLSYVVSGMPGITPIGANPFFAQAGIGIIPPAHDPHSGSQTTTKFAVM